MADAQIGNPHGFAAKGVGDADTPSNLNGGTDHRIPFEDEDMDNISVMRTRLAAIDATAYSATNLNTMSYNDMVYALRVHDSPTSLN